MSTKTLSVLLKVFGFLGIALVAGSAIVNTNSPVIAIGLLLSVGCYVAHEWVNNPNDRF